MMKLMKAFSGCALLGLCYAGVAQAEIPLLQRGNNTPYLNNLSLEVGGSVRGAYSNEMGSQDDSSRNHRGVDDGTRFRFRADYYFNDDWRLLAYYEVGTDVAHWFGDNRHVNGKGTDRRQLYGGVASKTYGKLTYGKQESVYYQTISKPLDYWVQDKKGQPAGGFGFNPNYDNGERSDGLINYENTFGDFKLLGEVMIPTRDVWDGSFIYRRGGGAGLAGQYSVNDDLTLGAAYTYQDVKIHRDGESNQKDFDQHMVGASVGWTPGQWHLAASVGYYKDYVPNNVDPDIDPSNYFVGNARSWEGFVGYTFDLPADWVSKIQPYAAHSSTRWSNFDQTYNYLGVVTRFPYRFSLWIERQFSNTSDNQPDVNKVRLRYDF
ncbi:porin [Carnimonas bestiolae]|uniref:porin n=1 Tax=Carnimonas bestiolae TaxID=3402172 RepID=UPI003F4AED29